MRLTLVAIAFIGASAAFTQIPKIYDQPYRPQFHFSPREHWTNDPNGLVYFEGEYHLFFQYNPFGNEWGHMTWGHAVSTDLVHWTELAPALKEENGIMIFTGSAVVDYHNSSGFCLNNKPCLIAVYTGYTPPQGSEKSLQTQNVAFSNDRGRTWTKYSGNPVLDLHMTDFRDPKVFWFEKTKRWIMAVSLPDDHKIRFYESANLKTWSQLSDFGPAGATGGQWECPEIFELPVEGESGRRLWALKVGLNPGARLGGSGEQYFIGDFDGKQFKNANAASQTLWTDYGKDCYCALTFNNLPATQPAVMIGWMDNWQYAAQLPTSPWRGQMTVPRTLWLSKTDEGIRLYQRPNAAIEQKLKVKSANVLGTTVDGFNETLRNLKILADQTFEINTTFSLENTDEVGWRILQGNDSATVIGYDTKRQILFIDRTHSGNVGFQKDFPSHIEAPLKKTKSLQIMILVDRSSVEVFADGGRITMTALVFPLTRATGIEAYLNGESKTPISATVTVLTSSYR